MFFLVKSNVAKDDFSKGSTDSGMSNSWKTTSNSEDEKSPLLLSDSAYRHYTEEKVQYYEQSRKQDTEVC